MGLLSALFGEYVETEKHYHLYTIDRRGNTTHRMDNNDAHEIEECAEDHFAGGAVSIKVETPQNVLRITRDDYLRDGGNVYLDRYE